MDSKQELTLIFAPREGVNDDTVRVIEWLVEDGSRVEAGTPVVVLETAKSSFHLDAPRVGFVFRLAAVGTEIPVGSPVAILSDRAQRPTIDGTELPGSEASSGEQLITNKAKVLIDKHGLSLALFSTLAVVREVDVEAMLQQQSLRSRPSNSRTFRGEVLDLHADWDATCNTSLRSELSTLLTNLRKRMKARFDRHVSTGNLLSDRWDLAKDHGFGEGTSVYDDCLILGQVKVGCHCWVGPQTILDGLGGLTIGDYVDVGAGTHLYSHNTIERALTGHKAELFRKPTLIGSCCFIAPGVVVAPGSVIGDHCFVAVGSYVEGCFPSFSYIAGNPARRVGVVEVRENRARLILFGETTPGTG